MKKILVPYDFSPQARVGAKMACQLSNLYDCFVELINVVGFRNETIIRHELIAQEEDRLKALIKELPIVKDRITFRVLSGKFLSTILEVLSEEDVEMMVMGTKGSSGISEWVLGSNAEKLVHYCNRPVLTIKHAMSLDKVKKIVYATDLADEQEKIVKELKRFQKNLKAHLYILAVLMDEQNVSRGEVRKRMVEFAQKHQFENYSLNTINDINEEEGIFSFVSGINADIIAMATHSRRGLNYLFKGSVAESIVNHVKRAAVWTMSLRA
ncbi:universal stress protein [Xanthovirga aplysinae]|uniref:universal stress protein n=1 Tax=Xanthovirga aplysinae TaxID=2529853 RepID=UPI0012BBC004|nr:universal stress protein [Xanthovirga aplysinae]MTI31090.1 universal stress protein [Xanthovirga aplysinae]